MTWQVFGRFGDVVWRGKAASAAEAQEKAVRANKVRWLDVTEVSRVPGAAKRNARGVRSARSIQDNPSPFRVGARVQDEYGNVGTVVHVPTSRGGSYHVDMDGDGQRPLSAGRALLLRSEIRAAPKARAAKRRNDASARLRTSKPRASASLTELKRIYTDHHWGEKPTKVFKIKDPVVPKGVVAMGRLEELDVAGVGPVAFPDAPDGQADLSCAWIGWDPKHPRKRLYIILPAEIREKFRNMMKHAEKTETLAQIAKRAGGAHAKYRYPNIKAAAIGRLKSETYRIIKKGDGWSSYIHEHGEDGMGGTKPVLAMDVSGRLWFCGGDYSVKEAGIVG